MKTIRLKIQCEHVSKRTVFCKRVGTLDIGLYETPLAAIKKTDWSVKNGNVMCPEHS